jgi:hypothetical protein
MTDDDVCMRTDHSAQFWLKAGRPVQRDAGFPTCQSNCWQISMAAVFWPSRRRLFMELAR